MDIYEKTAEACLRIAEDRANIFKCTSRQDRLAVVSDGSSLPGFGNIGPFAAVPAVEEKASILGRLTGLSSVPICLYTQNADEIVDIVIKLSPAFGGVYLESISEPRCYEIEKRLSQALDIPALYGGRWGTGMTGLIISAGLLKGAMFEGVTKITEKMFISASELMASEVIDDRLGHEKLIPYVIDRDMIFRISRTVSDNK